MEIITILGDSLALPRQEVTYKDTYAYKLSLKLENRYVVLNRARRGNTTAKQSSENDAGFLIEDVDYYHQSRFVIIQLGIVDCAPRLFSERESKLLGSIRPSFVREKIIGFKSKRRLFFTKHFPLVYVTRDQFLRNYEKLLKRILNRTDATRIFLINIADTTRHNKTRSYGFERNIVEYNKVIQELSASSEKVRLVDLHAATVRDPDLVLPDGIHIAPAAHNLIADFIHEEILHCPIVDTSRDLQI